MYQNRTVKIILPGNTAPKLDQTGYQSQLQKRCLSYSQKCLTTLQMVGWHGKKFGEPQHECVISNPCYNKMCYKGTAMYMGQDIRFWYLSYMH